MSIINETLDRLEAENRLPASHLDRTRPLRPPGRSMGVGVKVLGAAMLLMLGGTSLMVWHWDGRSGGFRGPSVAEAGSQAVPGGQSDQPEAPSAIEEQASPEVQSVVPDGATAAAAEDPAAVPQADPAGTSAGSGRPEVQAAAAPPQTRSGQEPTAVADRKSDSTKAPSTRPQPAAAAAASQQRPPATAASGGGSREEPEGKPDHRRPPAPVAAKTTSKAHTAARQAETAPSAEPSSGPPAPGPAASVSETEEQPIQANAGSPQPHSGEKSSTVPKVEPARLEEPKSEPRPVRATSDKRQSEAVVAVAERVQPGPVDQAVEQARLALARGRYQQALAALETLASPPGGRPDFWLMKGSAHLGMGQLDAADKAFAAAQTLAPRNAQIAVQRAIVKQEQGDHAGALRLLEDAADHHPDAPEVFLNRGYSQLELGAVRDAAHSFRIFLKKTEGRSVYSGQRRAVRQWLAQMHSTPR